MQGLSEHMHKMVSNIIENGILPTLKTEDDVAYTVDPVFNIIRNRVNAEIFKTLYRLNYDEELLHKMINHLCRTQNVDGSWNEIHPNYNKPSALITSFIGEALLLAYETWPEDKKIEASLRQAKDYVLSQEKSPGYFLKSSLYSADHLNVDASCGAFLAQYAIKFSDFTCLESSKRSAKRICENQSNGAYPYTTDKGNYGYNLNVPCIHYQGVTMYYLSKMNEVLNEEYIKSSLLEGAKWLSSVQSNNGRFDWSKSGLMFAYYLTGAYAFAYSSYIYVSKWEKEYIKNAELCLKILENNYDSLAYRWEKQSWNSFLPSFYISYQTAAIGNYPLSHRIFRYGYGMYRQIATRRFSDKPLDDPVFSNIVRILRLNPSVIEASKNFHDLFMSSEILDCLTKSMSWRIAIEQ